MLSNELFVLLLGAVLSVVVCWACKRLPEERWRLACISFGCCYGVSLDQAPLMLRRVFDHWHFVFSGKLKKIAYDGALEGQQVLPIQAMTALLYILVGLVATLLFLHGRFTAAFILVMAVTQGWRVYSETLRADYQGSGKVSAYQMMGLFAIIFAAALSYLLPTHQPAPELSAGLDAAWQPLVLLSLQTLWVVVFVQFGKSMVTGAEISFHLHHDRI